jgi:hypothetical protein
MTVEPTSPFQETTVPVEIPAESPVEIPAESPVEVPGESPLEIPGESPIEVPGECPVEVPGALVGAVELETRTRLPRSGPPPGTARRPAKVSGTKTARHPPGTKKAGYSPALQPRSRTGKQPNPSGPMERRVPKSVTRR